MSTIENIDRSRPGRHVALDRLLRTYDPLLEDPDIDLAPESLAELKGLANVFDLESVVEATSAELWRDLRAALVKQLPVGEHEDGAKATIGLTVLVVEDDPESAALLVENLLDADCDVIGPVDNAEVARVLAGLADIDVALVDMNLSGSRTGADLARDLQQTWGIPSIFLSGDVSQVARNADASIGYLIKPYKMADVTAALSKLGASHGPQN